MAHFFVRFAQKNYNDSSFPPRRALTSSKSPPSHVIKFQYFSHHLSLPSIRLLVVWFFLQKKFLSSNSSIKKILTYLKKRGERYKESRTRKTSEKFIHTRHTNVKRRIFVSRVFVEKKGCARHLLWVTISLLFTQRNSTR